MGLHALAESWSRKPVVPMLRHRRRWQHRCRTLTMSTPTERLTCGSHHKRNHLGIRPIITDLNWSHHIERARSDVEENFITSLHVIQKHSSARVPGTPLTLSHTLVVFLSVVTSIELVEFPGHPSPQNTFVSFRHGPRERKNKKDIRVPRTNTRVQS